MAVTVGAPPAPAPPAAPSAPTPLGYVCPRASVPLQIDGRLDDLAWRDVPWTADFVDVEGDARPRPALRTRAKMLWDDEYFYVGAETAEPHLWATLTRHDAVIFQDILPTRRHAARAPVAARGLLWAARLTGGPQALGEDAGRARRGRSARRGPDPARARGDDHRSLPGLGGATPSGRNDTALEHPTGRPGLAGLS
ncbi:MAG: hypothetical protein DMF77_07845 [Acidobacteria bacterium]|nr:MAG: hypothetical protein DMF77_07845 [Acidobacteriota bacterium]